MKFRKILNEKKMATPGMVYDEKYFKESVGRVFSQFSNKLNNVIEEYFKSKRGAERLVASVNTDDDVIFESEGRSSVRMSILSKAWRLNIEFKRPSIRKIVGEERKNIISFLVEHKDDVKFSSTSKDEFGAKEAVNNAVDKVFTKRYLDNIFENSDKELFYAISGEIKKYVGNEIAKSKSFRLNTEKRISELDLTFIDTLKKRNLTREPNGKNTFPDYEYVFSGEAGYTGEQQIYELFEKAGIKGSFEKVYIEMKGDKSPRVVTSQTTPNKFFKELGEDLKDEITGMDIGDTIEINAREFRRFINAANINYAFDHPIIFVKSATKRLLIFYIGDIKYRDFKLKRNKKSLGLSLVATGDKAKEQKIFSIEFTSRAYREIFG